MHSVHSIPFHFLHFRPQCFCYWGYCGDDCSTHDQERCASKLYNITDSVPKNDEESCLFELTDANGLKVWYNLSEFDLKNENFVVDDEEDREYVYKFNICGNLENFEDNEHIPSSCRDYNHGPCTHVDHEQGLCVNDYDTFDSNAIPKAVQIYIPENETWNDSCWWLGMDLPDGFGMPSFEVSLIDTEDAGRGVVYRIRNGEKCDEGKRNRELNVRLICPDTRVSEFDPEIEAQNVLNETVLESETCLYELSLESPLACPLQCINEQEDSMQNQDGSDGRIYQVCSSHGICASDPEAKQVRCICDDGYEGMTCQQKSGSDNGGGNGGGHGRNDIDNGEGVNGNGVGIGIAVSVILLMLGVVGAWYYVQRRKRMVTAYGDLMSDGGLIQEEVSE